MPKAEPSMPIRPNGTTGLVGLYFHTFQQAKDGCWVCRYQGHIDSLVNDETLLVTLFEWLTGSQNTTEFLPVADLIAGRAEFYDNPEAWREAPEYGGGLVRQSRMHYQRHDNPERETK